MKVYLQLVVPLVVNVDETKEFPEEVVARYKKNPMRILTDANPSGVSWVNYMEVAD